MLRVRDHATSMGCCYDYGVLLRVCGFVTSMASCYEYGIMLRVWGLVTSMGCCYEYGIMLRDHSTSIWIILRVCRHTTSMGSWYEYGVSLRVWRWYSGHRTQFGRHESHNTTSVALTWQPYEMSKLPKTLTLFCLFRPRLRLRRRLLLTTWVHDEHLHNFVAIWW